MPKLSNIYQDKKSKKWYFVANLGYDEHGKRIRFWHRGFETQRDAKEAYDEYMNSHSKSATKINSTMSYKEFYETYFEADYQQSVSAATFENRNCAAKTHLKYFGNKKLKDIDAPMIKKWQNSLSKKYKGSYIRNVYGLFQMSLDLAVKLNLLNENIARKVGNVKKDKVIIDFWTLEEFQKVISTFYIEEYYDHFSFTLIWLLFMTGLRFGEAQGLEWSDINLEEKTLTVNKSMTYKNANDYYINPPKTRASNRTIALDDKTVEHLTSWRSVQSKSVKTKYVLSFNGLPMTKGTSARIITRQAEVAKVHRIKTHALRHSHASLLISLGENALIIRDRLGHEDIETTLGTYGHLYPNVNRGVADKLSNLSDVKQACKPSRFYISNQHIKRSNNFDGNSD